MNEFNTGMSGFSGLITFSIISARGTASKKARRKSNAFFPPDSAKTPLYSGWPWKAFSLRSTCSNVEESPPMTFTPLICSRAAFPSAVA